MDSYFSLAVVFIAVLVPLFAVGFYFLQKRFWPLSRNASRTAPPSTPDGVDNKLGDKDHRWRPPRAS